MKKLRLLVTEECNRSCEGCCNKQFDLNNLPTIPNPNYYNQYDIIMITGGEPLLFRESLLEFVKQLKFITTKAEIILYTAKIDDFSIIDKLLQYIDGITITLHKQYDIHNFLAFDTFLFKQILQNNFYNNKSYRLNVFSGIDYYTSENWITKDNIEWIENCPLPKDETFMKIKDLFKFNNYKS